MAKTRYRVLGIDLSGPANHQDTSMAWGKAIGRKLHYEDQARSVSDMQILDQIMALSEDMPLVIGIDAPLSYNDGGGQRERDRRLRERLKEEGYNDCVGVMAPTMTGMAYLTLRGISLTRAIAKLYCNNEVTIVEVHPGAAMALQGAPRNHLRGYKKGRKRRSHQAALVDFIADQGFSGLDAFQANASHDLDAVACALSAWRWLRKKSLFIEPAKRLHPYILAC